jgi:protein kinase C substrate 80K-H
MAAGVSSNGDNSGSCRSVEDSFTCISSFSREKKIKISSESFNDDYCDCADGSDEPLTSACSGLTTIVALHSAEEKGAATSEEGEEVQSVFYTCPVKGDDVVLATSKLCDGVCDCCGGEDESSGKKQGDTV